MHIEARGAGRPARDHHVPPRRAVTAAPFSTASIQNNEKWLSRGSCINTNGQGNRLTLHKSGSIVHLDWQPTWPTRGKPRMRTWFSIIMLTALAACDSFKSPEQLEAAERESARAAAKTVLRLQKDAAARFVICLEESEAEGLPRSSAVTLCSQTQCLRYHRAAEHLRNKKAQAAHGEGFASLAAALTVERDQKLHENSIMVFAEYCHAAGIQM